MEVLNIAIQEAKSVGNLAKALGVKQNVISNWRLRKSVPKPWLMVLERKYAKAIKAAQIEA